MFGGRRRQSVHSGFGHLSPQKGGGIPFGRLGSSHGRLGSSHGRSLSPRTSSSNLNQESARLSSLAETPDRASQDEPPVRDTSSQHWQTNGVATGSLVDTSTPAATETDIDKVPPPPGPPPSRQGQDTASKDAEGFTIRAPMDDPISEAQREAAAEEADRLFKLNIQNKPVEDEDPDAKQAALSNVANSLKMGPATRRSATVRGRRDVRNTIYVPPATSTISENHAEAGMTPITGSSPLTSSSFSRPPVVQALASEASVAGTSDTQSVRSGNSLSSVVHAKHPDMSSPGLNASIIETVSVVFEDGAVKSASIAGEVAFVNNASDDAGKSKSCVRVLISPPFRPLTTWCLAHEIIRINNFPRLERIGPNRIFVHNASPDQPDEFSLDLSHLSRTSVAFSYRVFSEASETPTLAAHAPLLLKPAWKLQGDKLGLLLQYQLNPSFSLASPVTLHNVVFVASYDGRASGAQTKPSGTHLKDKHIVYWRLGDVTLTGDTQKIVCRIVGAEGVTPTPGHVEARWEYAASAGEALGSGISISRLVDDKGKGKETEVAAEDDPFADQSQQQQPPASPAQPAESQRWADVPLQRKLVSGKYEGK